MPETIKGGQALPGYAAKKIFAIWHGQPGSGKTSALLSYPPPIHFVNLDKDPSALTLKLPAHYEIVYEGIQYDMDLSPSMANTVLAKIEAMILKAAAYAKAHPDAPGSFCLDGSDLWWDDVKIAKLPKGADEAAARDYADANAHMNTNLARLYNAPMHVGLSAMSKEIWRQQSKGTGTYDPDGFRHRGRWITHEVYMFSPEDTAPTLSPSSGETGQTHRSYIQKSKLNEALVRRVIPNLSFKVLYKLTFGELPANHEQLWTPS